MELIEKFAEIKANLKDKKKDVENLLEKVRTLNDNIEYLIDAFDDVTESMEKIENEYGLII